MQAVPVYKILIILTFCSHLVSEGTDVNKLFTDVAHEHFVNCPEENFAIDIPAGGNPNDCCGFCDNWQFCKNSGTCCLGFYSDFEGALRSKPTAT